MGGQVSQQTAEKICAICLHDPQMGTSFEAARRKNARNIGGLFSIDRAQKRGQMLIKLIGRAHIIKSDRLLEHVPSPILPRFERGQHV